ncbi:hypothetical protein B0H19DRAFT_1323832 [Mycena capillaripes]|nr:hypothetical protein B0H19DRAFT_1323832 [Mycena capillaripes]
MGKEHPTAIPSKPPLQLVGQFSMIRVLLDMDCLPGLRPPLMMQMLLNDTAELKERVSSVETTLSELQSSSPARGIAAQRGGRITRSKRGALSSRRPQVPDESDVGASQSTATDVSMDSDIEPQSTDDDSVVLDGIDVTKKEHRALQSYVSKTFRRVCNVPGRSWPDPDLVRMNTIINEIYPAPVFGVTVNDHQNKRLFHEVAHQAFVELQEMAKESFRSFTKKWKETQQIEAAINADVDRRNNRRLKRRQRKSQRLVKILNTFAAQYGLDPAFLADLTAGLEISSTELYHVRNHVSSSTLPAMARGNKNSIEKFLARYRKESQGLHVPTLHVFSSIVQTMTVDIDNDEWESRASGPEDDSGESKEAWKVRIAAAVNLSLHPDAQKELKILEILVPAWRSTGYSRLIHDMQRFCLDDALSDQELKYNRVPTDRLSDRIPRFAPYDFGISIQWWKENRYLPANKNVLKDWFKWAEPDTCGLSFDRDDDGEILNIYYTQSQQ